MQHSISLFNSHQHNDEDPYENTAFFVTDIADPQALDIVEALSQEDLAILLDRAISTLPPTTRQIVEMCYLREVPQREAAARLGLTLSALEARLHRARLQLRQLLNGPLHTDATDLGLRFPQDDSVAWSETRLWCSICGQHRLVGRFKPQPDGSINLHLRCPHCWPHYKLLHTHSMGLVQLAGLQSFRPAWKRTMQEETQRLTQALSQEHHPCPRCGRPAFAQVVRKDEQSQLPSGVPPEIQAAPIQFWVGWTCPYCRNNNICFPKEHLSAEYVSADELVFWSHPATRKFILDHPRRINGPEQLIEYAGQPAISFQLIDVSSTAQLTVIADRFTLQVLAVI